MDTKPWMDTRRKFQEQAKLDKLDRETRFLLRATAWTLMFAEKCSTNYAITKFPFPAKKICFANTTCIYANCDDLRLKNV